MPPIRPELLDELLKDYRKPDDLLGQDRGCPSNSPRPSSSVRSTANSHITSATSATTRQATTPATPATALPNGRLLPNVT